MSQLVLGTAEFNPLGYQGMKPIPLDEIDRIFRTAKEAGITLLDTAESYDCVGAIKQLAKGFCIYTKTRDWRVQLDWGNNELRGILYHYTPNEKPIRLPFVHRWVNLGASAYDIEQLPEETRIVQIPYNIDNTQFIKCFSTHRTVFVRSVFARGDLLKRYTIKQCLDFVKKQRPDGIIVGVKTAKELEQIIKAHQ